VTILERTEKTYNRCELCGYNRTFIRGVVVAECECVRIEDPSNDEMKKADVGTLVAIACSNCEGHQDHQKQGNGKWKCLWCKHEEIEF
jgi:hypothetical protein